MTAALALARLEPKTAAEVAESIPAGEKKISTICNIAFQWARVDMAAARQWAEGLSEEDGREQALEQVNRASGN